MNAYIVAGYRTAVGKAPRGLFKFTRPDELSAAVINRLLQDFPQLDKERINDVIVGNATPEAEQGLNVARMISILGLNTVKVPGMTINRYCSSGIQTIAIAASQIHSGMADCIIAGGVETMSPIPFGGWRIVPNSKVAKSNPDYYWGMGLTAEAVANEFNISRQEQDEFAYQSHTKALNAIDNGLFKDEIVPIEIDEVFVGNDNKRQSKKYVVDSDEGPRRGTTVEALANLKPVFAQGGSVTAGNSSQTSDGAAFVLIMSEKMVNELNIKPIARMVSYQVVGLEPRIMGVGPLTAIPAVLKHAGMTQNQIDLFELNEAFASQSLAVIKGLDLDSTKVNVNGGAIALGHPLACTGAKLSVQIFNELKRRKQKYGMVTMCVGTGQGAAGIYEML
ncbi:MAG: acetyl-CoA C-acyltransferase [Flavobacteriales bacterium]|nr:acetyl-CoA C-acyltransferase [Flavobacteriales bacterium]